MADSPPTKPDSPNHEFSDSSIDEDEGKPIHNPDMVERVTFDMRDNSFVGLGFTCHCPTASKVEKTSVRSLILMMIQQQVPLAVKMQQLLRHQAS